MAREEAKYEPGNKNPAPAAPAPLNDDAIDESSRESFPASDAPAWTTGPSERERNSGKS